MPHFRRAGSRTSARPGNFSDRIRGDYEKYAKLVKIVGVKAGN
jgi:hypothetical protein